MNRTPFYRAVVSLGVAAALALPAAAQVKKDWTELRGTWSAIAEPHTEVVQDGAAWKALWAKHTAGAAEPAPAVDFTNETVAAVFLGMRMQPQPVEMSIEKVGDQIVIHYKDAKNRPNSFGPAVVCQPFEIRKFPKAQARIEKAQAAPATAVATVQEPRETGVRDAVAQVSGKLRNVFGAQRTDTLSFDGALGVGAKFEAMQLPPPPGQQQPQQTPKQKQGGGLPPPPQQGRGGNLPPPPDQGGNLPPPPGGRQGSGNLPPPPDYRPRPSDPGRLPPPPGNSIPSDDSGVSTTGYWKVYRNQFGYHEERFGNWQQEIAKTIIERGGSETNVKQSTRYTAKLDSRDYRNRYVLHYRWIGTDCDPNDTNNCLRWEREWKYFYEDTQYDPRPRRMAVVVEFDRDQPLVPWEKESIRVSFDGSRVWVDYPHAAFNYTERGPIIDQQLGTATLILTPTSRILRAPEKDKVQASLRLENGQLKLVVNDARTQAYAGERLEIAIVVKWDKPWSLFNPTVMENTQNGPIVIQVDPAQPQRSYNVPASNKGEYWIDSWSFRRAGSKTSSAGWVHQGGGNKVTK